MTELIILVAVICTVIGAVISTINGWWGNKDREQYKVGRLLSSAIIAIFASFSLVNVSAIPTSLDGIGWTGLAVTYLLLGYGADRGLARLDK